MSERITVDDFEDLDTTTNVSGWSYTANNTSIQVGDTGALEGSGYGFFEGDGSVPSSVDVDRGTGRTIDRVSVVIELNNDSVDNAVSLRNSNGRVAAVVFESGLTFASMSGSWSEGTPYRVIFDNIEFGGFSADIRVEKLDGTLVASRTETGTETGPLSAIRLGQESAAFTNYLFDSIIVDYETVDPISKTVEPTDTVTVSWDDIREASFNILRSTSSGSTASDYTQIATVSSGTYSYEDAGLSLGTTYYYRVEAEWPDGTTDLSQEQSALTDVRAPSGLSTGSTTRTSVDLSWTDNAVKEESYQVDRREQREDGSFSQFRQIDSLPADTTTYTDSAAKPETTFEYRVVAVDDLRTAESGTAQATTNSARFETTSRAASGWTIEIDHPSGQTLRPDLVGEPVWNPTLNGIPTLTVQIRGGEEWQSDDLRKAPVRAWHDGERLPVSQISGTTVTPEGVEITARGSTELDTLVRRSVVEQESHKLIRNLVQDETSLVTNVDDPNATTTTDTLVQSVGTADEIEAALASAITSTDPLTASGSQLDPEPIAVTFEAEDTLNLSGEVSDSAASASAGEALFAGSGFQSSLTFSVNHEIPASAVGFKWRRKATKDADSDGFQEAPGFRVEIDGETVHSRLTGSTSETAFVWRGDSGLSSSLQPGDHTLTVIEDGTDNGGIFNIDLVTVHDTRFSKSFPNTLDGDYLPGPERFAPSQQREFADVDTARQVVGGSAELQISSTANNQSVSISNDSGSNYITANNSATVDGSFQSGTTQIRLRVTLSRHGSRSTATPTQGFRATTLDAADLFADLNSTPLVDNQVYEGRLIDVVTDIADDANFISELTYEPGQGPTLQVTTPGQRTADANPDLTDYSVTTEQGTSVRKAIVKGRSQPEQEEFTANHDTAVQLSQDYVKPGSDRVTTTDESTTFDRETDYQIDWQAGTITVLSSGAMSDNTTYQIAYQRETRAVKTAPDFSGDPTEIVTAAFPSVATETAAANVARILVQSSASPRKRVSVEVETGPTSWSLVDALSLEGVPLPSSLEVQSLEDRPSGTQLQLASRRPIQDVIDEIQSRLGETSRAI